VRGPHGRAPARSARRAYSNARPGSPSATSADLHRLGEAGEPRLRSSVASSSIFDHAEQARLGHRPAS
jgi:hypothetical protein